MMKKQSVFDRLASTETFCSAKHKEKKESTNRAAVHNQRHHHHHHNHHHNKPRDDSIFERLNRQQTASSLAHHGHYDIHSGVKELAISPPKSTKSGDKKSIFDRLSHQQTEASRGRQVSSSDRNKQSSSYYSHSRHAKENKSSLSPSNNDAQKEKKTFTNGSDTKEIGKEKNTKPLPFSKVNTKILCSDRYNPERGYSELSPSSLSLGQPLYMYTNGQLGPREMAYKIIEALFERDFGTKKDKRWDIDPACLCEEELDEGGNLSFQAEKQATWDWKDIYSVASSKGKIRFLDKEDIIRVENYSYYVAG